MTIGKRMSYEDQKLTKKVKPANQGGGPNYLGKQKEVTVPKKWLSSPDHVVAELAYITPREQKILLDADIYGSLKGKPNKGPGGIMSLQGDLGGWSSGGGGKAANEGRGGRSNEEYKNKAYYNMMTGTGKTATSKGGDTYRSKKIAKGAVPEYVNTPGGMKYVGSKYKSYGQPGFLGKLFGGKNPGYRGTYGTNTGLFDKYFGSNIGTRKNPITGELEYFSEDERVGDVKPGMGGRILGGLAGLLTGIPGVGSIIGNQIDKYKPKSMYDDMSEFNKLTLGGTHPAALDFNPDAKIQDTSFSKTPSGIMPNAPSYSMDDQFLDQNPEVRNMLGINRALPTSVNTNTYEGEPIGFIESLQNKFGKDVTPVGMNQKQIDYLNAVHGINVGAGGTKNIGSTMHQSERSLTDLPGGAAGAFYEYSSPADVLGRVKGLDKHSEAFWGGVNPDKIVEGDVNTFAQPDEITRYVESLAPENTKYSWGLRENEPGVDYTDLAKGGRVGYADGGLATLFARRG